MRSNYLKTFLIILLTNTVGCSSSKEFNEALHGGENSVLFIYTDSTQLDRANPSPPPLFVPYTTEPSVVYRSSPTYPYSQLITQTEADVNVKVWVNKQGRVVQVIVFSSTNDNFNIAAADAAIRWKFRPALIDGKPVDVWISIPFRFRIKSGCAA